MDTAVLASGAVADSSVSPSWDNCMGWMPVAEEEVQRLPGDSLTFSDICGRQCDPRDSAKNQVLFLISHPSGHSGRKKKKKEVVVLAAGGGAATSPRLSARLFRE